MNVPKLRFNEFSQDWLSDVLNNLADVRDGTHDSPKYHPNGYPLITSKNLMSSGLLDLENVNLISEEDFIKINKRSKVEIGDILFGMIGTIGNPVVIKTSDFAIKNVALIKQIDELDNRFLSYYLKSSSVLKQFEDITVGNSQKFVSLGMLRNLTVLHPLKAEQTKIANFLTAVDEKITQLTKKHKLLNQYKKGVMQKIFSQELRFKDDDGIQFPDWESTFLGRLCSITTGKLDANAMVENGQYRFYTCAREYYQIDTYAFDTEALLISGNGANVGYIHYYKGKFNAYQRTYVLDGFEQNIIFIKYFLDKFLHVRIFKEAKEGNTPYIVMSTLTEMDVNIPSAKEQIKIANFLSAIDDKITATQSQLELVKQYKQGLLQQMFV